MGKGSQQVPTDQTVRQTQLPEYADPYFRRMLQGAEESLMPWQPRIDSETGGIAIDPNTGQEIYDTTYRAYPGERIAPSEMYGDIQASRAMVRGIAEQGIPGMEEAMGAQREGMDITRRGVGYTEEGIGRLRGLADYRTGEFTPFGEFQQYDFRDPFQFSEYGFRPDFQFQQFQFREPERFTGQQVQEYMSPYMQSVVEQQQRQAQLEFERQGAGRAAQAVQAGAFGGSRQAVQEALAEEALARQMGDIQARGSQAAFEQAAQQFGTDRAARMAVDQARAAELARVQSSAAAEQARVDQARYTELANRESAQAAEFARAGNAEAAEAARVQAARYDDLARRQSAIEQSRQFGASQALAAEQAALGAAGQMGQMAQGLGSLGQSLAGLGQQQRAADIQGAQLLETIGRDIRAEDQARLDLSYEDFLRQRDYPITQYERMAGILRGVPVSPNVEETRLASYNPTQQALGAGISALGLYKGLMG
jgi:primosomal replication protein N